MRTYKLVMVLITSVFLYAFTSSIRSKVEPVVEIEPKPVIIKKPVVEFKLVEVEYKSHNLFLEDLGKKESNNNYKAVNTYGYMGRYQFGASTLKGLGFKVTKDEFLNSPYIQEKAMQKLLTHNKKKLQKYIDLYCGKEVNGIMITESGILAAAHLGGAGNVRKWFKGREFKDGYGTSLSSYMENFGGYYLDI